MLTISLRNWLIKPLMLCGRVCLTIWIGQFSFLDLFSVILFFNQYLSKDSLFRANTVDSLETPGMVTSDLCLLRSWGIWQRRSRELKMSVFRVEGTSRALNSRWNNVDASSWSYDAIHFCCGYVCWVKIFLSFHAFENVCRVISTSYFSKPQPF